MVQSYSKNSFRNKFKQIQTLAFSSFLLVEQSIFPLSTMSATKGFKNEMSNTIKVERMGDKVSAQKQKEVKKEEIGEEIKSFFTFVRERNFGEIQSFLFQINENEKLRRSVIDYIKQEMSKESNVIKKDPICEFIANYILKLEGYRYTEARLLDISIQRKEKDLSESDLNFYRKLIKLIDDIILKINKEIESVEKSKIYSDDLKIKLIADLTHTSANFEEIESQVLTLIQEKKYSQANKFISDLTKSNSGVFINDYFENAFSYTTKKKSVYFKIDMLPGWKEYKFIKSLAESKNEEDKKLFDYINSLKLTGNTSYMNYKDYNNYKKGDVGNNTDSVFKDLNGWKGSETDIKEFYMWLKKNNINEIGLPGIDPEFFYNDFKKNDFNKIYHGAKVLIYLLSEYFSYEHKDIFDAYPFLYEWPVFIRGIQSSLLDKAVKTKNVDDITKAVKLFDAFMYTFEEGLKRAEKEANEFSCKSLSDIKQLDLKLYEDINKLIDAGLIVDVLDWDKNLLKGRLLYSFVFAAFNSQKIVSISSGNRFTVTDFIIDKSNLKQNNITGDMDQNQVKNFVNGMDLYIPPAFTITFPLSFLNAYYDNNKFRVVGALDPSIIQIIENVQDIKNKKSLNYNHILPDQLKIYYNLNMKTKDTQSISIKEFDLMNSEVLDIFSQMSSMGRAPSDKSLDAMSFEFPKTGDNVFLSFEIPDDPKNRVFINSSTKSKGITVPYEPFHPITISSIERQFPVYAVSGEQIANIEEYGVSQGDVKRLEESSKTIFDGKPSISNINKYSDLVFKLVRDMKLSFIQSTPNQSQLENIIKDYKEGKRTLDEEVFNALRYTKLFNRIIDETKQLNARIQVSDVYSPERIEFKKRDKIYALLVGPRFTKYQLLDNKGNEIDKDTVTRGVIGVGLASNVAEWSKLKVKGEVLWTLDKDVFKKFGYEPDKISLEFIKDKPFINKLISEVPKITSVKTFIEAITAFLPDYVSWNRDSLGFGKYGTVTSEMRIGEIEARKLFESVGLGKPFYSVKLGFGIWDEKEYWNLFNSFKEEIFNIDSFEKAKKFAYGTFYTKKIGIIHVKGIFSRSGKLDSFSIDWRKLNENLSLQLGRDLRSNLFFGGVSIRFEKWPWE